MKEYKKSLEEFRKVLVRHPNCPATVRLGIGYCFERLGKNYKARDAFERVLELEPDNVDALIAVAMLDLQTRRFDDTLNAINMLRLERMGFRKHQLLDKLLIRAPQFVF